MMESLISAAAMLFFALLLVAVTAPLWVPLAVGAVELLGKAFDLYARVEAWRDRRAAARR
ncbi:MAG: hypothetical protein LBI87_11055 [Candidatus Accumulibacter sp.]|jgi:hypothetical protein|nr:hypothetical protein [Accumulibacter sp.]